MAKSREYKGYVFEDNGHGDLYNAEVDKFLIFRPYPMMVQTIIHKDGSVTMNKEKFKENTDKNKGVYEEGYETNDDGSVYVEANDVDESIYQESKDNRTNVNENEISDDYKVGNLAQQEKWNSYFTLESPVGDMEAAQEYLDADDMTQYIKDEPYGHKIDSIKWVLDDEQGGHVEILTNEHLTEEEANELQDWIDGQNSDGLGEGFEQQDFANAYYNPDTGEGPYTYQEAEQAISDIIDSADISDIIDYVDESEIEAAVDTYMEDNDLYNKFIEEHQDEAYDNILEFVDPSEVEGAFLDIRGDDTDDAEMLAKDLDSLYDVIRSDDSLKEEIGNYLLQNLASDELADFVAGMEGGDDFREQCKEDMLNDDPEGYISDDAIYEARENYANDHYNTNIDEWGTMASMRRSVDGLQLETPAIEDDDHIMTREEYEKTWEGRENSRDLYSATSYEDYLNSLVDSGEISPMQREQYLNDDGLDEGEFKVSPGVMMDMVANGAKVKHDELYTTLAAADFVSDKLSDEFGANWRDVHEEDLREAITHFTNEYNEANVQPEYKNEDFYGDEANPDKVYDELMDRINVENSANKVNSNDDIFKGYGPGLPSPNDDRYIYGHNLSDAVDAINDFYGIYNRQEAFDRLKNGQYSKDDIDKAVDYKEYDDRRRNNVFGNDVPTFEEYRASKNKDYEYLGRSNDDEFVIKMKDNNGTFYDVYKDKDGNYKDANGVKLNKSEVNKALDEKAYNDHLNDEFDWRFNSNKTDFEREIAFNKAQRNMSEEDAINAANNSLKERVNNDYQKTLDSTRKEIQAYFDTPLDERLNEFGDKDDFYKYINDNYYNIGKNDFDRIYNEELQNRVSNDVVNSFNKIDNLNRTSRNQGLYDKIKVDKSNDAIKILQGTSNGSIDLEDNYEIRKYNDGTIQISSSHPYDLSDYSFAKYADYNTSFSVYSPKGELVTVVNTVDDAIDEMKKIDKKIKARIDRT